MNKSIKTIIQLVLFFCSINFTSCYQEYKTPNTISAELVLLDENEGVNNNLSVGNTYYLQIKSDVVINYKKISFSFNEEYFSIMQNICSARADFKTVFAYHLKALKETDQTTFTILYNKKEYKTLNFSITDRSVIEYKTLGHSTTSPFAANEITIATNKEEYDNMVILTNITGGPTSDVNYFEKYIFAYIVSPFGKEKIENVFITNGICYIGIYAYSYYCENYYETIEVYAVQIAINPEIIEYRIWYNT